MTQKINLFSIFDKKAQAFSNPFVDLNEATAQRTIEQILRDNQPQNLYAQYPNDYELHYIGELNAETGNISQENCRKILDLVTLSKMVNKEDMFKQEN